MIVILARFRMKDGKENEALEAARTMGQAVQDAEPGCLAYVCHRSQAEPSELVWYEVYEDPAALTAHAGSEHMQAFRQRLPDVVDVTQIKIETLERLEGFVRDSLPQAT
jgi:quinol monooxygenase YgiN